LLFPHIRCDRYFRKTLPPVRRSAPMLRTVRDLALALAITALVLPPVYGQTDAPIVIADPLLDTGPTAEGWFALAELDLIGPHIMNRVTGPATVNGRTDVIHLPTADLDWTVAPKVELGYRFSDLCPELIASYRFVNT